MKTYSKIYPRTKMVLAGAAFVALFVSCKKNNQSDPIIAKHSSIPGRVQTDAFSPANLSNALIAYWPLSNFANDLSGNGNTGTTSSVTATTDRAGNISGAYAFNGTTSYISVPNQTALSLHNTDFSLNTWVKLSNAAGGNVLSKRIGGDTTGWTWTIGNNLIIFGPGGNATHVIDTATIDTGRWYMVTVTYAYSTHTAKTYLNGALIKTHTSIPSPALLTAGLYIGRDDPGASPSGYFFPGSIGDVRMYNRTLSTTDISNLHTASCAPTGTVFAYWPLTNTVLDLSGSGNNGTANALSSATDRLSNSIGAYGFDGSTSYISVPNQTALSLHDTNFSLNTWVNLSNTTGGNVLSKRVGGDTTGWTLTVTSTRIIFGPGGNATHIIDTAVINTGSWYMVTVTYSYSTHTAKTYLNGTLIKTHTGIPSPGLLTAALYIGRDDPGASSGYFFPGGLNNIRIYGYTLNTTQITALYDSLD